MLYKRRKITRNIALSVDSHLFSLEHKGESKYAGISYGSTLYYRHFSLRLGVNKYNDFSEFVPTITYKKSYKKHSLLFEYTRQNALFYTLTVASYQKRIVANHFAITDFIAFSKKTELWSNIVMNFYSNIDRETTAQFDFILYKISLLTPKLTFNPSIEGWYTSHTKQNRDFYSPYFADDTILRIDPQYIFSKYFGIRTKLGIGYSLSDKNTPYKYGMVLFAKPQNNLSYNIGCLTSSVAKLSYTNKYSYTECTANLEYKW